MRGLNFQKRGLNLEMRGLNPILRGLKISSTGLFDCGEITINPYPCISFKIEIYHFFDML
ncbi:hypothetical protein [uncultured Rummeliibacillus sp.]|uniref:hypothetical protein n=1 Tax=uncultured Rummeliibacillus sp. TaxID=762292 RepID=UPI000E675B8D|nr:hypothetical protein [uncultured Rummeliibacillus sp.]RIJ66422.1 hypothetical protein D1606_06225 [Rummeliibacillus sp. POC4]RPJ93927.1 hypothetical protein CW357_18095 [Rummeliibacillus sp. TYF005]